MNHLQAVVDRLDDAVNAAEGARAAADEGLTHAIPAGHEGTIQGYQAVKDGVEGLIQQLDGVKDGAGELINQAKSIAGG